MSVVELGASPALTLISEYDPAARAIRINGASLRRVVRVLGDAEYDNVVRAAVAHELYHHEVAEGRIAALRDRRAVEREAEHFVRVRYGIDPTRFERVLR